MSVPPKSISRVVLHADDFGMNDAVNQGILTAFREGLLTSTSLLANAPAAESASTTWPELIAEQVSSTFSSAAKRLALADPRSPFDLGIHLNLTQGRPLTGSKYPSELLDPDGNFPGIGGVFSRLKQLRQAKLDLVAAELHTQIAWMCDRGLRPTHLNGHQYVELLPQIAAMVPAMLNRYSIPVVRVATETGLARTVLGQGRVAAWGLGLVKRYYAAKFRSQMREAGFAFPDRFFGTSHAGLINQQVFQAFFRQAFEPGCTEVGLHPGVAAEESRPVSDPWFDPLAKLRPAECDWLCGSELPEFLQSRGLALGRLSSLKAQS